jgi:phosphoglycolate phosphatase
VNVIFDLDGTLTDPRQGVLRCIKHALSGLGHQYPPDSVLEGYIGPPLHESFSSLFGGKDLKKVSAAIELYRERFSSVGILENTIYPGMHSALATLRELGATLYVATSKPQIFAERILERFDLACYFTAIQGSQLDGTRSNKADLIAYLLKTKSIQPRSTAMVGDRMHDVMGAIANGVFPVGVLWGYGSREELVNAGAAVLCEQPLHLGAVLSSNSALESERLMRVAMVDSRKKMRIGDIQLREASESDADFIYRVIETTMRTYVERVWGTFSEEYNRKNISETIRGQAYSIITIKGQDVGALAVERHSTHIELTQMYLLPLQQNKGVGTLFIRELAREARESGKPLRLRVLASNPARRLYEREGFQVTSITPERVFMELRT